MLLVEPAWLGAVLTALPEQAQDRSGDHAERKIVNLGARYSFKLEGKSVTARFQLTNLFDQRAFVTAGPGAYGAAPGRSANFFVAVDL